MNKHGTIKIPVETPRNGLLGKLKEKSGKLFKDKYRKIVKIGGGIVAGIAITGAALLTYDYFTKPQDYPIRDLVYDAQESVYFADDIPAEGSSDVDREAIISMNKGDAQGTKVGDLIGIAKIETTQTSTKYELENKNKNRIAYGQEKKETVQGGLRLFGATKFIEQYAELIGDSREKEKLWIYEWNEDRSLKHTQLNVIEDENGNKNFVNVLDTFRDNPFYVIPLGTFAGGLKYRDKTLLSEFAKTPENNKKFSELIEAIKNYDTTTGTSARQREQLVRKIIALEEGLDKKVVISSHEDGIIDWFPQDSSIYIGLEPNLIQRVLSCFGKNSIEQSKSNPRYPTEDEIKNVNEIPFPNNPNKDIVKIRVKNHWDLIPGYIPGLAAIGGRSNPFTRRNNGGYTIEDDRGVIAQVKIQDFWLYYGDDLVYKYYLDKNGDGKIDSDKELIGKVLYNVSRSDKIAKEAKNKSDGPRDATLRVHYAFMAGSDWKSRFEDFYLCNAIESTMMDQVERGFGKHSELGFINHARSNILLAEHQSIANLARVRTPTSTAVATLDAKRLFNAAGRDYINNYLK